MATDLADLENLGTCAIRLLALTLEHCGLSTQFQLHLKDDNLNLAGPWQEAKYVFKCLSNFFLL